MPTPLNPLNEPIYKFIPISADKAVYYQAVDTVSIIAQAFGSNSIVTQPSVSSTTDLYIGVGAGASITTGIDNVLIGPGAGTLITTPNGNVAVGYLALNKNITGLSCTAVGYRALTKATVGDSTAVGYQALVNVTSGAFNTAVGYNAGIGISTVFSCLFLGAYAGAYETAANSILIDAIDRVNLAGGRAGAPFYAVVNATPTSTSQLIQFNCGAMGFYGTTPIAKPVGGGNDVTNFTAVGGTTATSTSTWTGASGASTYTVGDIVTALKALGLLTA